MMRRIWLGLVLLLGVLFLTGSMAPDTRQAQARPAGDPAALPPAQAPLVPTATPSLTPPPLAGCWTVVEPAPPSNGGPNLRAVTVVGNEVWAVGGQSCNAWCALV